MKILKNSGIIHYNIMEKRLWQHRTIFVRCCLIETDSNKEKAGKIEMIQDIYPHRFDNSFFSKREAEDGDSLLIYTDNGEILVRRDSRDDTMFPQVRELKGSELTYLFSIDGKAYFGLREKLEKLPEDFEFRNLKEMRSDSSIPIELQFAAASGMHLYIWYRDNRFCGRCGKRLTYSDTERAMVCPDCRNIIYPRINPAVIVGVINGEKILLTKYRKGYKYFALIAGFTEFGESLEECVRREVFEETGLRVKNIRYYRSQPWGIVQDILVGFYCEVDGSSEINMDSNELKLAGWYSRDEIVLQPDEMSLTGEMMRKFKRGEC